MHQLTQQLKSGKMEILEVPLPQLLPGNVLVRNYYSVISAGTESKTVSDARKGYISKALSRQKEVRQVIELIKTQGFKGAYNIVMNKLEAPSPLGYSCAGEIIAIAGDVKGLHVGELVACGGNSANHADIVAVPKNLCAKVDPETDLKEAAFTTIASIAIQGIRQADLQIGGSCVVVGLGMIGIITMKILESSGIRAFGIDISSEAILRAQKDFKFNAVIRNTPDIPEQVKLWSQTQGADAVIITAATPGNDPINLAGELCHQKGKVIMVGAVSPDFDRTNYYRKELDLRMSCSYGPGRYDPVYEDSGIDYPVGYVRWTEQRNMQAILNLLNSKKLSFSDLITHTFELTNAPEAYDLILSKKEPYLGILIEYDKRHKPEKKIVLNKFDNIPMNPNAGIIGAGAFAQNILLPILKNNVNLIGISTSHGNSSVYTGRKYNFKYAATLPEEIFNDPEINTIFILTRHNFHAKQTIQAMKAGKNVFVEKPLALNNEELNEIEQVYNLIESPKPIIMSGFNRRFSPAVIDSLKWIKNDLPKAIHMRINAGNLPVGHWVHDLKTGGGRIVGEACHFIDLAIFLAGSQVESVSGMSMNNSSNTDDTLNISLKFLNGSIAHISYFSNGNKNIDKELIEIFTGQTIVRINDFKSVELITPNKKHKTKYRIQDKGHQKEIDLFTQSIKQGKPSPIPFEELVHSMKVTFEVVSSLEEKRTINI